MQDIYIESVANKALVSDNLHIIFSWITGGTSEWIN